MKHALFRGLFLGCSAILAAVVTLFMPATASAEPIEQAYERRVTNAANVLILDPAAAVLPAQTGTEAPDAQTSIGVGPIAPV